MNEPIIEPLNGLSYVRGVSAPDLLEMTVCQMLAQTVDSYPDKLAAVFREHRVRWTWNELALEVDALATALLELDLPKGSRVGLWAPNRPEWLVTQLAVARLGMVLVNINPAYRIAELEHALNVAGCAVVITADRFKSSDYLGILQTLLPELATSEPGQLKAARVPGLHTVVRMGEGQTPGMLTYSAFIERGRARTDRALLDAITASIDCHAPADIQFTSGTTGSPKGATLTHYAMVNNSRISARHLTLTEKDALCIPIPLYHAFGMILADLACISTGAAMVFPGEAFDAAETLAAIQDERCTAMHAVPTMLITELAHPRFKEFDLTSLRTGMMAGAPCPIETMKRVVSDMHMSEVSIAFGMTETSGAILQSATTDPLDKRVSTVGRILPHLEAKVVGVGGETVPVGQTGELLVRGYTILQGYWGDPERTRQAIVDGWLRTGDLATIDAQGYCSIVGRVKDMLIRGGENIYPREVEEFLYRHPAIQTVQVFGVPDVKYGEEVCAWIVLKPGESLTEEAVRTYCKENISHYKVPRYVKFVQSTEMPTTVTGKVQKYLMRSAMVKELGLSS